MVINPWEHFKIEGDKIIFTIPEPSEKLDKKALKVGIKLKSSEYISWEIANGHFERINSVLKETRQQILQRFKKGGITIGETAKLFNVSADVVSDIIAFNIFKIEYLNKNSI